MFRPAPGFDKKAKLLHNNNEQSGHHWLAVGAAVGGREQRRAEVGLMAIVATAVNVEREGSAILEESTVPPFRKPRERTSGGQKHNAAGVAIVVCCGAAHVRAFKAILMANCSEHPPPLLHLPPAAS